MSILYLHIGAPKTGSTYIQSCLRMSRESLTLSGLIYPKGTENDGLASQSWTSGNAHTLFDDEKTSRRVIDGAVRQDARGLVLSSEALIIKLENDRTRQILNETIGCHRFSEVRILAYLRNPIQWAVSSWLQFVKNYGETQELDDFLRNTRFVQKRMALIAEVLEYLSKQGFGIQALNYSACKPDILTSVSKWLEIDRDVLATPPAERINRSLDIGEVRLQLEMNRCLGTNSMFLARALTEGITHIEPEKYSPSEAIQESIWDETRPWVERINHFLPKDHELVFDKMEYKAVPQAYRFTEEQIRIIAETLCAEIRKPWERETRIMKVVRSMLRSIKWIE